MDRQINEELASMRGSGGGDGPAHPDGDARYNDDLRLDDLMAEFVDKFGEQYDSDPNVKAQALDFFLDALKNDMPEIPASILGRI
jgi:hypothetical protein